MGGRAGDGGVKEPSVPYHYVSVRFDIPTYANALKNGVAKI